jgi:hypothetical protein
MAKLYVWVGWVSVRQAMAYLICCYDQENGGGRSWTPAKKMSVVGKGKCTEKKHEGFSMFLVIP